MNVSRETLLCVMELLAGIQLKVPPTDPSFKGQTIKLIRAVDEISAELERMNADGKDTPRDKDVS